METKNLKHNYSATMKQTQSTKLANKMCLYAQKIQKLGPPEDYKAILGGAASLIAGWATTNKLIKKPVSKQLINAEKALEDLLIDMLKKS